MASAIKESGMDEAFVKRISAAQDKIIAITVKLISLSPRVFSEASTRVLYKAAYSKEMPLIMTYGQLRAIMACDQKMSERAYAFCIRLKCAMAVLLDAQHGGWNNSSELDRLVWLSHGENAADELEIAFENLPEFVRWRDSSIASNY
jgi:hypothetical protein